jgi:hypothetical protein
MYQVKHNRPEVPRVHRDSVKPGFESRTLVS